MSLSFGRKITVGKINFKKISFPLSSHDDFDVQDFDPDKKYDLIISGSFDIPEYLRFTPKLIYIEGPNESDYALAVVRGFTDILHDSMNSNELFYRIYKIVMANIANYHIHQSELDRQYRALIHNINNPLGAVTLMAELFEDFPLYDKDEEYKYNVDCMNRNLDRVTGTIHNLQNLLRIRSLNFVLDNDVQFSIDEMVECINDKLSVILEERQCSIKLINRVKEESFLAGELDFICTNIIAPVVENAVRFSAEESTIILEINAHTNSNMIKVSVHDPGMGIPAEFQGAIFESVSIGTRKGMDQKNGGGLGLCLALEAMKSARGTIGVNSEEGKGTEIILTFVKGKALAKSA